MTFWREVPATFHLWKEVPNPKGGKPLKVPCDVLGDNTNHMNPNGGFYDYDTAVAVASDTGFRVGWSIPEGYFLFDMDDVREPNGEWSQWAIQTANQFPTGIAIEQSINKNGLHIIGKCEAMPDRRNKFHNGKAEFYYKERFVAIGTDQQGSTEFNCTATLLQIVPQRALTDDHPIDYDGPVPEYKGPSDDGLLIGKMLASKGGAAVIMGAKISVQDLWNGDPGRLAQAFPSGSNDAWDRSSADQALMNHLAFWTGKDFNRMDRLFRQSALMREKYEERKDYRNATITGAIRICKKVYAVDDDATDKIERAMIAGELLTGSEQKTHFDGCVYVTSLNKVLTPDTGVLLDQGQFRIRYGGYKFLMASDSTDPTKSAWEAFTENRMIQFPKVDRPTFRPEIPFGAITTDVTGRTAVNTYKQNTIHTVDGDISPFIQLMGALFPDERDRRIVLSYMAAIAQYPGSKFLWSPVVIGDQGNGKSTLIYILRYIVDGVIHGINDDSEKYSVEVLAKDIDLQFNAQMNDKLLAAVHEMHSDNFKDQRERQDILKALITETTLGVEFKRVDKYTTRNVMNWFFCSNHKDAVRLEENERRFAVFYTPPPVNGLFYRSLWSWLKKEDGFAKIAHYLKTVSIPVEFDPTKDAQRAPITSCYQTALWESMPHADQMITRAIQTNEPGFCGGFISSWAIRSFFEGENEKPPHGRGLAATLKRLGYVGGDKSSKVIMMEGGSRPRLYWRKGMTTKDVAAMSHDYMIAQGYEVAPAATVTPLRTKFGH